MKNILKTLDDIIMKKGKNRMSMRRGPSLRMKVKTAQRVAVIAGISVLMFSIGIFVYMNLNNVKNTKAASLERVCAAAAPAVDFDVKSLVQLPLERQPGSAKHPEIINKRKAVILPNQN